VPGLRHARGAERAVGERSSTHATITFGADFDEALCPSAATPPMGYFVKKYDVEDQAAADPARDHVRYALEGMLNHPMAHAQLVPYESAESHQAFMKRFNQTMTLAVMFRDKPVGRVTPNGFEYALAEEDQPGWLDALQMGARIMFAAGARRVFFNSHQPLILNAPEEIDTALTLDLVRQQRILITERGAQFGYHNLVADMTAIPVMKEIGYPVVFDAGHQVRRYGIPSTDPAGGAPREFIPVLLRSAVAAGANFCSRSTAPRRAPDACT